MARTVYLNFSDLNEDSQQEIMDMAIEDIENDAEQIAEITDMYGEDRVDEIVRERAERVIYSFNYIFNV